MSSAEDLVTWLRAQFDEDERLIAEYESYMAERRAAAGAYVPVYPPGWRLGEPFDPSRARREVESKRRILDTFAEVARLGEVVPVRSAELLDGIANLMALPYAGRPGYRDEWRP